WDKKTRRFYLAIPTTVAHPNGEVDEIAPNAMPASGGADFGQGNTTRVFPTTCSARGKPLLPKHRFMNRWGDALEAKNGALVTTVRGVAADEIWFNPGDERVYFGHNPAFVVDAETYKQITGGGAPIPAGPTHSIAADSENNHIFIPVT